MKIGLFLQKKNTCFLQESTHIFSSEKFSNILRKAPYNQKFIQDNFIDYLDICQINESQLTHTYKTRAKN